MLALLIYWYANGIFSSRRIQRATDRDLALRYLTGNTPPDRGPICTFRRNNQEAIAAAFVDVLELARERKLLKLGIESLDGTQIQANASTEKNVTDPRAQPLPAQLRQELNALRPQANRRIKLGRIRSGCPRRWRGGERSWRRRTRAVRGWKRGPKSGLSLSEPKPSTYWANACPGRVVIKTRSQGRRRPRRRLRSRSTWPIRTHG